MPRQAEYRSYSSFNVIDDFNREDLAINPLYF